MGCNGVFRNMKCCYPSFKWDAIVAKLDCLILAVRMWEKGILLLMIFLYVAWD